MNTLRYQIGWIATHWRRYSRSLWVLAVLTLANAAVLVAYPWLIKRIINGIEDGATAAYLWQAVGIMAVMGVLHFAIYFPMQYMRAKLNLSFEFAVRLRAFERILRMGPSFFAKYRTGDLVTRLNDDVSEKLSWYMCSGILRVVEALALIVFGIGMMFAINPTLTLYTAGPLPILIGLFVFTAGKLHERYEVVQQTISELNESLESCFSGIRVVKAFAAEAAQREIVNDAVERQRQAEIRVVRWQTVIDSFYGHVWQLAIIGVLLAGGAMAIDGKITLGDIVAFDFYVLLLVWPMFDIGQFLVRGKLSAVCIGRIDELETAEPEVPVAGATFPIARRPDDPPPADEARNNRAGFCEAGSTIEFVDAGYRYPSTETPTLDSISFRADPGTLTAVVGEIGSGKSTLLSLIPRLVDVSAGRLLIDQRDVREWRPVELRQRIGYVPQEIHLFSGTVEENIRFGREWVIDTDIAMAINVAALGSDVNSWPDGLQTVVGPRGVRLSGGQKQRVALARALAGRPSILLLDDCTASLDAETEDAVWRKLIQAIPDCTTLLVTHRPATLERADQIVLLKQGRLHETGTFAELEHEGTLFHRLYVQWKLQERVEE